MKGSLRRRVAHPRRATASIWSHTKRSVGARGRFHTQPSIKTRSQSCVPNPQGPSPKEARFMSAARPEARNGRAMNRRTSTPRCAPAPGRRSRRYGLQSGAQSCPSFPLLFALWPGAPTLRRDLQRRASPLTLSPGASQERGYVAFQDAHCARAQLGRTNPRGVPKADAKPSSPGAPAQDAQGRPSATARRKSVAEVRSAAPPPRAAAPPPAR